MSLTERLTKFSPLVMSLALLALVGGVVYMSFDLGAQARRIPLVVGVPTLGLVTLQVAREAWKLSRSSERADPDTRSDGPESPAQSAMEDDRPNEGSSLPATFGWIVLLGLLFWVFGMVLMVPIFVALFCRLYTKEPWYVVAIMMIAILGALYTFFVVLLGLPIYDGLISDVLP